MSFKKYSKRGHSKIVLENPTEKQLKKKRHDAKRVKSDREYINREIERRGGCEFCGAVLHNRVYEWHHIWDDDPTNRRVSDIAGRAGPKRLDKEFAKTVLLCPTCHRVFHMDLCCMFEHKQQHIDGTFFCQPFEIEASIQKPTVVNFLS